MCVWCVFIQFIFVEHKQIKRTTETEPNFVVAIMKFDKVETVFFLFVYSTNKLNLSNLPFLTPQIAYTQRISVRKISGTFNARLNEMKETIRYTHIYPVVYL